MSETFLQCSFKSASNLSQFAVMPSSGIDQSLIVQSADDVARRFPWNGENDKS